MGNLFYQRVKTFMKTVSKLLLLLAFIPFAYSQAMSTDEAHRLVASALDATKKQPFPDLGEPDALGNLRTLVEFKKLSSKAEEVWKVASLNLNLVAQNEDARNILFDSFEEGLSPESYLQFINRALDFYQSHIIDKYTFTGYALVPDGNKRFFLPYNYQDPRVRAFLLKVKTVFADDRSTILSVDHILSGNNKIVDDERRAEDPRHFGSMPIQLLHVIASPSPK